MNTTVGVLILVAGAVALIYRLYSEGFDGLIMAFQLLVVFAVGCVFIYFELTDNGYVIGLFSIGGAYVATQALAFVMDRYGDTDN